MPISDFWKNKTSKDGLRGWCKFCEGPYNKKYYLAFTETDEFVEWQKEYKKKYLQEHPWPKHLKYARERCNSPKHASYRWYGGKGVRVELKPAEIECLWQTCHADTMNHPTLDRINDTDPQYWDYAFSNCRFLERDENIRRSLLKRRKIKEQDRPT